MKGNGQRLFNFQGHFESYKGQQTSSKILYCACGFPVLARQLQETGLETRRFFSYTDYEEEILHCPDCGLILDSVELTPQAPGGV